MPQCRHHPQEFPNATARSFSEAHFLAPETGDETLIPGAKYATSTDQQHAVSILTERRLRDPEYRAPTLSKLFRSKLSLQTPNSAEVNRALRAAIAENASLGLVEAFILTFGASVSSRTGTRLWNKPNPPHRDGNDALRTAVRGGSVELVSLLAAYADQTSLDEALADSIQEQDTSKTQALSGAGADPGVFRSAICQAAARFDVSTLEFIGTWNVRDDYGYRLAFTKAVQAGDRWHSEAGLKTMQHLLKKGACGDVVNDTFLQAVQLFLEGRAPEALIDLFLTFDVDIDFSEGDALEWTIKAGNISLLQKLMHSNPNETSLTCGLYEALISGHPPELFVQVSEIMSTSETQPVFEVWDDETSSYTPLLYHALRNYPTSPVVVRRLLEMGSSVECERQWQDDSSEWSGGKAPFEQVNALTWVCSRTGSDVVSTDTVEVLLEFGADSHWTTEVTSTTPLLLATRHGRRDLVRLLLAEGVDVSAKDSSGRSPLFNAASIRDTESVRLLIQKRARVNDGSLHEAARQLYADIIPILTEAGHDPNFTSTKHDGATPLGELALFCEARGDDEAESCIDSLVRAGADPLKKSRELMLLYPPRRRIGTFLAWRSNFYAYRHAYKGAPRTK